MVRLINQFDGHLRQLEEVKERHILLLHLVLKAVLVPEKHLVILDQIYPRPSKYLLNI